MASMKDVHTIDIPPNNRTTQLGGEMLVPSELVFVGAPAVEQPPAYKLARPKPDMPANTVTARATAPARVESFSVRGELFAVELIFGAEQRAARAMLISTKSIVRTPTMRSCEALVAVGYAGGNMPHIVGRIIHGIDRFAARSDGFYRDFEWLLAFTVTREAASGSPVPNTPAYADKFLDPAKFGKIIDAPGPIASDPLATPRMAPGSICEVGTSITGDCGGGWKPAGDPVGDIRDFFTSLRPPRPIDLRDPPQQSAREFTDSVRMELDRITDGKYATTYPGSFVDGPRMLITSPTPTAPVTAPDVALPPESIRAANRVAVDLTAKDPPDRVLDGRGRRSGPAWERYQRALADALEQANARPDPVLLNVVELFRLAP